MLAENEVDDESFHLLDDATLKELIPKVGQRLKFKSEYSNWKDANDPSEPVEVSFTCFKCLKPITGSVSHFFNHIKYIHNINASTATNIICHESGCLHHFSHCKTYKKHIIRHHLPRQRVPADFRNGINDILDVDDHEIDEDVDDDHNEIVTEEIRTDLKHEAALFFASLKRTTGIPISTIKTITEHVEELMDTTVDHLKSKLILMKDVCQNGVLTPRNFETAITECDHLKDSFASIKSEYNQLKYAKELGVIVLPEENILGSTYSASLNKSTGRMEQVKKSESFMYVSIQEVLKLYLQLPGMMRAILEHQRNEDAETGVLKSYQDGRFFKEMFQEVGCVVLPVLLYSDDWEPANPLGSRKGVHKLCAFYMSLLCLPRKFQSRLNSILLVALVKSQFVTKYGIDSVQKVIVQDFQKVYDYGIYIDTPEFRGIVRPKLFQVVGDNLGVHGMLGYARGFTANYPCRHCKEHRETCKEQVEENTASLRDEDNFAQDIELNDLAQTGVSRHSIMNELSY